MAKKPSSVITAEFLPVGDAPPAVEGLAQATQPADAGSSARGTPVAGAQTAARPASSQQDKQTERFYERLEQTGQLVDVDEKTDLSTLPSHVTHVRFPNGFVKRIQFD